MRCHVDFRRISTIVFLIAALWWRCVEAWVPFSVLTSKQPSPCSSTVSLDVGTTTAVETLSESLLTSASPPHKQRKSVLEKSCGVLYRKSVLTREEYSAICDEIRTDHLSRLREECSTSIAQKRLGTTLNHQTSEVVKIIKSGSLHRLVEKVAGSECELATELPVEVRTYSRQGAGMAWHVDDVLYDPPQIEVIWTMDNYSDCKTMWKEHQQPEGGEGGVGGKGGRDKVLLHSVETEPNSALLLLAGGAPHCVTHLKHGSRVILKFAYVKKGATYTGGHKNQFDDDRRNGKKKKKKRAIKGNLKGRGKRTKQRR